MQEILEPRAPFQDPVTQLWIITRYKDVTEVLHHPARYSSSGAISDIHEDQPPEVSALLEGTVPNTNNPVMLDGPIHQTHRAWGRRFLGSDAARDWAEEIESIAVERAQEIANKLSHGPVDLVPVADDYVRRVMAAISGVAVTDIDRLTHWSDGLTALIDPTSKVEARLSAARELRNYDAWARAHLAAVSAKGAPLERLAELDEATQITWLRALWIAGIATTRDAVTATVRRLLLHDMWVTVRRVPETMTATIDEALRVDSPHQGLMRVAVEHGSVGGVHIPEGARLMLAFGVANRDPEMYACPEEYHLGRKDVGRHLAFGGGPHRCVAAPLARVEIETAVRVWNRDLPELALAEPGPARWRKDWFFRGLEELLVRDAG